MFQRLQRQLKHVKAAPKDDSVALSLNKPHLYAWSILVSIYQVSRIIRALQEGSLFFSFNLLYLVYKTSTAPCTFLVLIHRMLHLAFIRKLKLLQQDSNMARLCMKLYGMHCGQPPTTRSCIAHSTIVLLFIPFTVKLGPIIVMPFRKILASVSNVITNRGVN